MLIGQTRRQKFENFFNCLRQNKEAQESCEKLLQQVNALIQNRNWQIQTYYKQLVKQAQPKTREAINAIKTANEQEHKLHEEQVEQVSRSIVELEVEIEQLKE